jgi:uncharacterized protein (UPF0335 family)
MSKIFAQWARILKDKIIGNSSGRYLFCYSTLFYSLLFVREEERASTNHNIPQIYQELKKLPFDNAKLSKVENLTLQKDRAKVTLESGTLYYMIVLQKRESIIGRLNVV